MGGCGSGGCLAGGWRQVVLVLGGPLGRKAGEVEGDAPGAIHRMMLNWWWHRHEGFLQAHTYVPVHMSCIVFSVWHLLVYFEEVGSQVLAEKAGQVVVSAYAGPICLAFPGNFMHST